MALGFYLSKKRFQGVSAIIVAAGGLALFGAAAGAQSISQTHLEAARKAIAAIHATDQFDSFLPDTATELKNDLSQRDPDLADIISKTVDEQSLALVPRRTDLEKEVARIYAKQFTEAELDGIAKFYSAPTGKKLLKQGPAAIAESAGAYDIWRQGVAQDLAVNVGKALDAQLSAREKKMPAQSKPAAPQKEKPQDKPALKLNFGQ